MGLLLILTVVWGVNLPFVDRLRRLVWRSFSAVDGKAAISGRLRTPYCPHGMTRRQLSPDCRDLHSRTFDACGIRSHALTCRLNEYCCWWLPQKLRTVAQFAIASSRPFHPMKARWSRSRFQCSMSRIRFSWLLSFVVYTSKCRNFLYCKKFLSDRDALATTQK